MSPKWFALPIAGAGMVALALGADAYAPAAPAVPTPRNVVARRTMKDLMRRIQNENAYLHARVPNSTILHRYRREVGASAGRMTEALREVRPLTAHAEAFSIAPEVWNARVDSSIAASAALAALFEGEKEPSAETVRERFKTATASCAACHDMFHFREWDR